MSDQINPTPVDPLFDELKTVIASGHAVFIIGTGVSISATFAKNPPPKDLTWIGLLESGIEKCAQLSRFEHQDDEDIIRREVQSGRLTNLLSAAEKISTMLGAPDGGDFNGWLYDYFSNLKISDPSVPQALQALNLPLITTNYDGVLEQATSLKPYTWKDISSIQRILRPENQNNKQTGIIHLHGFFEKSDTVILGIRSYETFLNNPSATGLREAISALKSIIFVGMGQGLEDPNFSALFNWIAQTFSQSPYRHYYLCRKCEKEGKDKQEITVKNEDGTNKKNEDGSDKKAIIPTIEPFNKRFPNAQAQRLYPVSYGENFSDLAPFLRSLQSNP